MVKLRSLPGTAFAALAIAFSTAGQASVISPGPQTTTAPTYLTDGSYLFGITVPMLGSGTFLLPVEITGASNLQSWQFDLNYDSSVVEAIDPGDTSYGIYGARFDPTAVDTLSFILAGFPLAGQISGVAGSYPSLSTGPSGDGMLAYILFRYLPGQQSMNPGFDIAGNTSVPEPGTNVLVAVGLSMLFLIRGRKAAVSRPAPDA